MRKIATLLVKEAASRLKEEHGMKLDVDKSVFKLLVEKGFSEEFGAREMHRAITENIEDPLSEKILSGQFKKGQTVKLTKREKETVRQAILSESQRIGQNLEALAVCTNHLHLAARSCCKSIERIVSMYKSVATRALRSVGRSGPIWTTGFDKRFCFTEADLARKIEYIQNHNG